MVRLQYTDEVSGGLVLPFDLVLMGTGQSVSLPALPTPK